MQERKTKLAILEMYYAGAATGINDLVVRLDKGRFDVTFMYLQGAPSCENHLEKAGFKVCYLSNKKRIRTFRSSVLFRLIRYLRQNQIDLLHCHAHKATQYGAISGAFLRQLKIIAHIHGLGRSARLRRKIANYLCYAQIDRFLPVANAVGQDLIKSNWHIPASKVTVLENSVDYDKFSKMDVTEKKVRRLLNIPQDAFVFGAVGRLTPTKGIPYLVDAFAQVKRQFAQAYLLLVGQGPNEQEYRELVKQLDIQDSVCFAGFQQEMEKVYRAMDVFVISSVAEGMPRVLLEAMASGVPCIGTKVGGIPEVIDDSTGMLVEAKDRDALAVAMENIVQKSAGEIHELRTSAQERVRTKYSHAIVSERLKNIYLDVLSNGERENAKG